MTFPTFLIAGGLAWLHYEALGRIIVPGLTVWVAWFLAVLIASGVDCWRSGDSTRFIAWAVIAASVPLSHLAWNVSINPLIDLAAKNLTVAGALLAIAVLTSSQRIASVAATHLVLIAAAFASSLGFIPGASARPAQFIAWSYPDVAAMLRHAALLILAGWHVGHAHVGNHSGASDLSGASARRHLA